MNPELRQPESNSATEGILVYHSLEKCNRPVSDIVKYSPFGKHISKTINGTNTHFIYDGIGIIGDVIAEYDNYLNVKTKYVMSPKRIDQPIVKKQNNTNYYYNKDALGSVTSIIDKTATVKNTYKYYAFGGSKLKTEMIENRYQYTAREYNKENELYHYRTRSYSSGIGRFLGKDKLKYNLNWYIYVLNNPLRWIDLWGYECHDSSSPSSGQPGTGQPGTGQPGTGQPGTGQPGTGQPGTGQPSTGQPEGGVNGGFDNLTGLGGVLLGSGIVIGTIAEDFITAGAGILDDPATIALGLGIIGTALATDQEWKTSPGFGNLGWDDIDTEVGTPFDPGEMPEQDPGDKPPPKDFKGKVKWVLGKVVELWDTISGGFK